MDVLIIKFERWVKQLEGSLSIEQKRELQKDIGEVLLPQLKELVTAFDDDGDIYDDSHGDHDPNYDF